MPTSTREHKKCSHVVRLGCLATLSASIAVALPHSPSWAAENAAALRGFPSTRASQEQAYERLVNGSPNARTAMRDERALAGHVHRMGQPTDYKTALYLCDRLKAAGWDAKIVTYVVAIAWPTQQRLQITAPFTREVNLYEPEIPGDPWSARHAEIGKPYIGYSADGDVTGPLIYANRGTAADFATLAKLGVNLSGAIVLVKMGGGSSPSLGRRAAAYGAKALLMYPEPGYDPYFPPARGAKPYPLGPGRPLGGALRRTLLVENDPGDPTAIGVPVPGAPHRPFSAIKMPHIPVSAITALVAAQLEQNLGGPAAPVIWKTKLQPNVHIGGVERVHFVLKSRRFYGPIWDVIATMKGVGAPDERIVVGGHRDAWTFGAIDPISGTVALLQLGDAFGKLRKAGWHPFRSVVIGSWDGEELNDFGSAIWADQHQAELRGNCWAYVNTDEVAMGPTLYAYATDDLGGLLHSVADAATAPDGTHVTPYWAKQHPKRLISPPGTGSDHESFTYHLNIPSAGIAYGGTFGTWHSAYDDVASLKVFDPGMRYADAAARFFSVAALRLADAPYPDIRLAADAVALQRRLNAFANGRGDDARRAVVAHTLQPYVQKFAQLAAELDNSVDRSTLTNNMTELRSLRALTFQIRSAFYSSGGIPGERWQRSVLYNSDDTTSTLPSLDTTLDPKNGDAALRQIVAAFRNLPPPLVSG